VTDGVHETLAAAAAIAVTAPATTSSRLMPKRIGQADGIGAS
jgi:hypothetical protein